MEHSQFPRHLSLLVNTKGAIQLSVHPVLERTQRRHISPERSSTAGYDEIPTFVFSEVNIFFQSLDCGGHLKHVSEVFQTELDVKTSSQIPPPNCHFPCHEVG